MPTRLCLEPRCPEPAAYRGRCTIHARSRERVTHHRPSFYNSARWRRTRRKVLFEQPLCACGAIATDVDHIVPIQAGGEPWARSNLQGLCHSCHSQKTKREMGGWT